MASTKTCPTCHGTGFHMVEDTTFDGYSTGWFYQEFCPCEIGQFREWQDNHEQQWEDYADLCQCPENVERVA